MMYIASQEIGGWTVCTTTSWPGSCKIFTVPYMVCTYPGLVRSWTNDWAKLPWIPKWCCDTTVVRVALRDVVVLVRAWSFSALHQACKCYIRCYYLQLYNVRLHENWESSSTHAQNVAWSRGVIIMGGDIPLPGVPIQHCSPLDHTASRRRGKLKFKKKYRKVK